MGYYENIKESWGTFDAFLESIKPVTSENQYYYAYSVRNAYAARAEMKSGSVNIKETIKNVFRIINNIYKLFTRKYYIKNKSKIILLEINPSQDMELADKINIPLAQIASRFSLAQDIDIKLRILKECFIVFNLMKADKSLSRDTTLFLFGPLINGAQIYSDIDLSGIEKIITQRDRYPYELAVLKKAKDTNIYTMKVEYFVIIGSYMQNTIYCENYYCPNKISRSIFRSFPQNDQINFIDGGFPYWDVLSNYPYQPDGSPRIVTFFTQYGFDMGIFGNYGPEFYINELLACLEEDMHLYIKIHPIENENAYEKYRSERVHIIRHGSADNWELVARSSYCFAISSFALLQAKHICKNSCYINYKPEDTKDFEYDRLENTIDLIRSRDELREIMRGDKQTTPTEDFIQVINPKFPNSTEYLKGIINS